MFHYWDGPEIFDGDSIRSSGCGTGWVEGIVEHAIEAGTCLAKDYSCWDTGGVLIREIHSEVFGLMLERPIDGRLDEDWEFICRKEIS